MEQIFKKTSSLGNLIIKEVPKALAKELIVENHYSHKWNDASFGKYNYGIFREDDPERCLGVAVYGYIKNFHAKIFTHPNPDAWMCELNRMWISDELGHNAETVLIAASIKLLRKADTNLVAVQSFADGRLGCGTIYKAANFKYYGYHLSRFLRNRRSNEVVHEQIFTNSTSPSAYIRSNVGFLLGDFEVLQVRTYRYIYPLCPKFKFCKPEQPYPEYNKGMLVITWKRDTETLRKRVIKLLEKLPIKDV